MARWKTSFMLVGMILLAGCKQSPEATEATEATAAIESHNVAQAPSKKESAPASNPTTDAGMFRWSSGMQMGQFWAAVGNKNGDYLRFFASEEDGNPVGYSPEIELANTPKLPREGELNIVVGDQAEVFSYELQDGQPVIQLLGNDGESSRVRALTMIREATKPICVEFPNIGYRTCFSNRGAKDSLAES